MTDDTPKPATVLAQANHYVEAETGAVIPPIFTSTTYARSAEYLPRQPGLTYSRDENPTYTQAEQVLAKLEGGAEALLFASGLAAATALLKTLSAGDHIVVPRVMYYGLREWVRKFSARWGLLYTEYDATVEGSLEAAIRPGQTQIVWVETPCNPTWDVTDIANAARLAHEAGAKVAVDSTVATPLLTQAIEFGADYVMHSATKFLNGHSDVVAGVLVTAAQDELWHGVRDSRNLDGAILGPFEAWLLLRGMRTMHLRVRQACENAQLIASHFAHHPKVDRVLYPGLPDHPGHEIAQRQMTGGFGAMMSIRVKGGAAAALRVAKSTKHFIPATSLGGVESLIEHRATVEGPESPVPDDLLRVSVGIEDAHDLISDLEQALAHV